MDQRGRHRRAAALVAGVLLISGCAAAPGSMTASSSPKSASSSDTGEKWVRDYHDDFDAPQDEDVWGRYGWSRQEVGNGAMGVYKPENVFTRNGRLVLWTKYANGKWTSAGVSGNPGFAAAGGKWEVRAKMPRAEGIGYAFLLYPRGGGWPPEIDIAEGKVNGRVQSAYHWGTADDPQQAVSIATVNTHGWHTYGVYLEEDRVVFTLDGDTITGTLEDVPVTTRKLWIGLQTGAMDPHGKARDYETVDGGVPNEDTPASTEILVDWVAHYHR